MVRLCHHREQDELLLPSVFGSNKSLNVLSVELMVADVLNSAVSVPAVSGISSRARRRYSKVSLVNDLPCWLADACNYQRLMTDGRGRNLQAQATSHTREGDAGACVLNHDRLVDRGRLGRFCEKFDCGPPPGDRRSFGEGPVSNEELAPDGWPIPGDVLAPASGLAPGNSLQVGLMATWWWRLRWWRWRTRQWLKVPQQGKESVH